MLNKPEIKYIIAIASGKGGVGKSTTAVNLALALSNKKLKVGLLDADIYGPNQPQMLGVSLQKPQSHDGKTFEPMIAHGIESMSIGYLIDRDTPMIWRGPIATNALQRLFNDTRWSTLDFLIIDLPPGTGDIQLTLAQKIPMTGAVIVTTPQEVALLDIRKAINMFAKVKIPIVGIVENMSSYICSQCGHEEEIFGSGGGLQIAQEFQCTLLGSLPLDKKIRERSDQGQPIVVSDPTHPVTIAYHAIAQMLIDQINHLPRNPFPKIVIEN
jgi:ATP-binding protein involved in chromosome partitioning